MKVTVTIVADGAGEAMSDVVVKLAKGLEPHEQHQVAERIAANVGYQLVPEGDMDPASEPAGAEREADRFHPLAMALFAVLIALNVFAVCRNLFHG